MGQPPAAHTAPVGTTGPNIEIVMAFDDAFWAPTYATMRSICLTTHRPGQLRFHLLHRTLEPHHRAAIDSIGHDYGATLEFVDLDELDILKERIATFPRVRLRRLNPIVYARLFLGELIDPAIERVLYLDSDLFVRTALDPLYSMDMAGHAIAAVLQPDRLHVVAGKDLKARKAFSMADPYFNAGVMLIDMAQYRQMDFAVELAGRLPAAELAMFYYDQDMINFCFKGRIAELDMRWNLQNPTAAHEVLNPHILHYSANAKPWLAWSRVAFKRTYRHLMTNAYFYQFRRERIVRQLKKLLRLA